MVRAAMIAIALACLVGCVQVNQNSDDDAPQVQAADPTPSLSPGYGFPRPLDASTHKAVRGKVSVQVLGADHIGNEDFCVSVLIQNDDSESRLEYASWGLRGSSTMKDNRGTILKPRRLSAAFERDTKKQVLKQFGAETGFGGGAVQLNRKRVDVLAFEQPLPSAKHIDLELAGANIGEKDPIRFRFVREEWSED